MTSEEFINTGTTFKLKQAKRIIEEHKCNFGDFLREVGRKGRYKAAEVIHWLGY